MFIQYLYSRASNKDLLELNERLEQDIQLKKRKLSSILGLNLNWSVRSCLNNWHICSSVSSWILGILVGWVCQLYMWNTGMFEYVIFKFLKTLENSLMFMRDWSISGFVNLWLSYCSVCYCSELDESHKIADTEAGSLYVGLHCSRTKPRTGNLK